MIRTPIIAVLCALAATLAAGPAAAAPLPKYVGQCALTRVKRVETRLEDGVTHVPIEGSGSAVEFVNGGYQVSYDNVAAVERSHPGDRVKMCLVAIPRHCPPGDARGRRYRTTNLRTHQSWTLDDSEHGCGGA